MLDGVNGLNIDDNPDGLVQSPPLNRIGFHPSPSYGGVNSQ